MSNFVDYVGLNTIVSDNIDGNTRSLMSRDPIVTEDVEDRSFEFVGNDQVVAGTWNISDNYGPSDLANGHTISVWFKPNDSSAPNDIRTIVEFCADANTPKIDFFLHTNAPGKPESMLVYRCHTDALKVEWDVTGLIEADKFYNVVLSHYYYADSSEAALLWVNGESLTGVVTEDSNYSTIQSIDFGYIAIGNSVENGREFEGKIQALSFFNNPLFTSNPNLVSQQVSELYNGGVVLLSDISSSFVSDDQYDIWAFGNDSSLTIDQQTSTGYVVELLAGLEKQAGYHNLTSSVGSNPELFVRSGTLSISPIELGTFTTSSAGNFIKRFRPEEALVAVNTHRNGPYGYSTWKQLRSSENPITRNHKQNSTMTFVTQPGPVRNVLSEGELRVRDRYSVLYSFTEPAIAQKAYPLVWNVGRHFKDENGNVDLENPERFSIISSYANQGIGFANNEVDKLHKFDPDEEKTEYREIFKLYAEGGLNDQKSPLTHWEFLQYRETIFPHMKNQFQNENLERPNFESFYRHKRSDRTKLVGKNNNAFLIRETKLSQSTWPLDEADLFLNYNNRSIRWLGSSSYRHGEGSLLSTTNQYTEITASLSSIIDGVVQNNIYYYDSYMVPGPLYMRRISLLNTASVSNPSGMVIPQTGGLTTGNKLFQGGALWEAGPTRQIKDADGNYVSAPKTPFYDTYEDYIEEARRRYKNFSVVPEFRMSTQVEDYLTNNNAIELDMFDVTGGAENAQNSSQSQFYQIYSNSDFMRQFELINEDHKEFTNGKVISLRCKAVKKFLPYEGFYPAQRTVDLAKRFYDSFKNNISLYNTNGVQLNGFNFGRQMVMTPLFAPGVLFNTIKSGIAVDYPIMTGSMTSLLAESASSSNAMDGEYFIRNDSFDKRIPFEALIEPGAHLSNYKLVSNEPHPSGNLSASAIWDGQGDGLYSKMANNFLAEVPEFFLPNGQLTSVVSKKQKDIVLESGKVYGMRVKMRRSMNDSRFMVHHSGSSSSPYMPPQDINKTGSSRVSESFTMYSRPSAFGPPTYGIGLNALDSTELFNIFDEERFDDYEGNYTGVTRGSEMGFNFPFTPPYYHGEAWCEMWLTASEGMSIQQIQNAITSSFTRFDDSYYSSSGITISRVGAQAIGGNRINKNAVQLSASLNVFGIGKVGKDGGGLGGASGNLVVDSAVDEDSRWIIQTKFETPMLNFNHISEEGGTLSVPVYGSESVPRGMWHQYGRIPEEDEGVFLEVGPIEENWWRKARGESGELKDLSAALGFSGQSTKIGRLRSSKKIYEAVVAVPFIESEGHKKFFRLNAKEVEDYKKGGEDRISLTSGDPQTQVGRSVLNQMQKMEKYIFPPSFDFLNYEEVDPIAMYIFEFSHTLSQQDLADIWQNLPPDIGTEMEESEVAITHPLLKKELLGEGGLQSGNTLIDMPNKLKWMVFKVKQRAASNYFKKTVLRNPEVNTDVDSGNATVDEFGATSKIQYNWPYDYFSLVELVKLDAEVEFGNFKDEDIANYTDSIPPYEAQTADMDKIEFIVGGMGDDIVADTQVPEEPNEDPEEAITADSQTFEEEGIFDVPSVIDQDDRQYYVLFKGRFTVEANKDPLGRVFNEMSGQYYTGSEGWGELFLRTAAELKEVGQIYDIRKRNTKDLINYWTQNWYNTDPGIQSKIQEALASYEGAQEAIANSVSSAARRSENLKQHAKSTFRSFYENDTDPFQTSSQKKDAAWNKTVNYFSSTPDFDLKWKEEIYAFVD